MVHVVGVIAADGGTLRVLFGSIIDHFAPVAYFEAGAAVAKATAFIIQGRCLF